jgi:heptose-I-phosphate ethanolaminephosphotransferase
LEQVLTFADEKNPDLYLKKPTLINLMKQAGYKTYWITNQQTQTKRNTMLTTFSKQADEQIYLNNNRMQDSAQYDDVVIKPFEKILKNTEQKKFIVIHLLGTHRKYHYRYPENFSYYNTTSDLPTWLSQSQVEEYNDYDNAVRFNDYVVATLIKTLKNSHDNGFLTYFSDHGEEVYDNPEHLFAGRNEAAPTSPMYTIPFIIWCSDSWMKNNKIAESQKIVHRAYTSSDFIYTWADLAGINFEAFDASRSIVNQAFSKHPIWIGDPNNPKKLRDLQVYPFNKAKNFIHIVKDFNTLNNREQLLIN